MATSQTKRVLELLKRLNNGKTVCIEALQGDMNWWNDKSYMTVNSSEQNYVIGYRHIGELYLNKCILITPRECIIVAEQCKLYFIDQHGYVLASFRLEDA